MWLWSWNPCSAATRSIELSVAGAGLEVRPWGGRPESDCGIIVFSEITPALCELIQFASNSGDAFVIAVSESRSTPGYAACARLLQAGAADIVAWEASGAACHAGITARLRHQEKTEMAMHSEIVLQSCIGQNANFRRALRYVVECALFSEAGVLLTGESGTGKEVLARLVHDLDPRRKDATFVVLDCTTISPQLSGSEFFGHVKGAFTGATSDREGAFSLADGGTLFLDEIGELPLPLQAELLRVLQERTYKPVGGNYWHDAEFRLIAATHRNLADEVRAGRFRHDLYFRLTAGHEITVPPLRSRADDVEPLARFFLRCARPGEEAADFAPEVLEYLRGRSYPGNVRQLKGLVERMALRYCGCGPVTLGAVPASDLSAGLEPAPVQAVFEESYNASIRRAVEDRCSLKEIGKTAQDSAIEIAIFLEGGNVSRAAQRLRVSARALQLRMAACRNGAQGASHVADHNLDADDEARAHRAEAEWRGVASANGLSDGASSPK